MQHTPGGWPYLGLGDYVDETPDYSRETANKLEALVGPAPGTIIDSGWVNVTLASGLSGDLAYRILNGVVYWFGNVTRTAGAFPSSWTTIANGLSAIVPSKTGVYRIGGRSPGGGMSCDIYTAGQLRVAADAAGPTTALFGGLVWPL